MDVSDLISIGENNLSQISDIPKLEALILMEYLLGVKKEKLLAYPERNISEEELKNFYNLLNKRVNDKIPLPYLINKKEFYSLDFYVNENVLIPRPETEKIVDMGLEILKNKKNPNVLDIGTGSGNIIIAISYYNKKNATYYASDLSYKAIKIARYNSLKHNQSIKFFVTNLFSGMKRKKKFDLIVSNPPYISTKEYENLPKEVSKEPQLALLAKDDGLHYIKKILNDADFFLKVDGKLIIEIGDNQSLKLTNIYCGKNIKIINDDFGRKRFLVYSPMN